jgi:pimeloyl-ACP methyl ester carboxylesterase
MSRALEDYPLANLHRLPDGRLVEWEAIGEGEPLIWVEGGPGLAAHLARPDVALLADRFRCHLVNAPGCGRTSAPATPEGYGLGDHVRFFEEVRQALELGPVTVMGHSWGGLIAVAWAIEHPESVRRLIVIDGFIGMASVDERQAVAEREAAYDRVRDRDWFQLAVERQEDYQATEAEQVEWFSPCWPLYFSDPDGPAARTHIERIRRELRWNLDVGRAWEPEPPTDLRPELHRVACPTLVVAGDHDFICGPVWNRPIADGIRDARFEIIRDAGHLPQYEQPDELRRIVHDWLAASDAAPFVPDDFEAPRSHDGPGFRLEPLGPQHNERDHEAWMSSIEHIHSTPGFPHGDWPSPMPLERNLEDLVRHAADFEGRRGFTYTVLDGDDVIGCLYIYPTKRSGHDAEVSSWVTASRAEMDGVLWADVTEWLRTDWPFAAPYYAERTDV